jgi:hypothetical protein
MVGDVGSITYAIPDDSIADVLSLILMHFGLVPECWLLRHIQGFGLIGRFGTRTIL